MDFGKVFLRYSFFSEFLTGFICTRTRVTRETGTSTGIPRVHKRNKGRLGSPIIRGLSLWDTQGETEGAVNKSHI